MTNDAPASTPRIKTWFIALLMVAILVTFFMGCVIHYHNEAERPSLPWIALLLGGPFIPQLVGFSSRVKSSTSGFWWFNWLSTSICQLSCCVLWIVYNCAPDSQWLSVLSLLLTFFMLGFVATLTFAIMGEHDEDLSEADATRQAGGAPEVRAAQPKAVNQKGAFRQRCGRYFVNLSKGVAGHSFWAITFFMSLFLGVSYLFGFALAFHDKNIIATRGAETPALHMVNLPSADEAGRGDTAGGQKKKDATRSTGEGVASDAKSSENTPTEDKEEYCFYFEEVNAKVILGACPAGYPNPKRGDPRGPIQVFNDCSLNALVKRVQDEIDRGKRVKVTLLGHTDNEPIKTNDSSAVRYLSNYELSQARAQNVQYEVLRRLRNVSRNLEWTIFPAADEPLGQLVHAVSRKAVFAPSELQGVSSTPEGIESRYSTEEIDRRLPKEEKRVVIATIDAISESPVVVQKAQVEGITDKQEQALAALNDIRTSQEKAAELNKSKPLRLMDYMYFSIYTITTTGYGDIVPTTAYAKFVTSVANVFEVIFLVVFFNAILSLKGGRDPGQKTIMDGKKPSPADGPTPAGREQRQSASVTSIAGRVNS